jgi:pyridoxine 4-dehydrogenase
MTKGDRSMSVKDSGTFTLGGKPVHRLGYGAMRITGAGIWGPPRDHDEAIRVLRRAVELGVTFIDTADSYGPQVSEDLIREALHDGSGYGDVVIGTKGGFTRHGPDRWVIVGDPAYLRQCVLLSARRLGVERIDLWQLHRIDPDRPADEQFGAIREFVDEGLIRDVGLSEVSVADIEAARAAGLTVASVQNRYNVGYREHEDVLEHCERHGIAFIPWAPVDAGTLTRPDGPLAKVAAEHGDATVTQVAIAWLLRRSPVMVPIPGTSRVAHLEENLRAADVTLSDEQFAALG